jgi:biotin carboxyl carrier protein
MLPVLAATVLALASPVHAQPLTLEGKTAYTAAVPVKNFYAGTVLAVSKKEGDAVRQGEPLGAYRLADAEAAAIREALDDTPLRAKVSQLLEQEMQIRNQAAQVEQLRNAVQAGYESPLRLESAQAGLELLQAQRDETRKARDDIASGLADEQRRISENLGGVRVTRTKVPQEIPLAAPLDGVLLESRIAVGQKLKAKTECFRVAPRSFNVKVRVYAEDFQKLAAGDTASVTIQGIPDRTFEARLLLLPLKPVDRGSMALSYYEVLFHVDAGDIFVREGLSARVTLP